MVWAHFAPAMFPYCSPREAQETGGPQVIFRIGSASEAGPDGGVSGVGNDQIGPEDDLRAQHGTATPRKSQPLPAG
jgi:hypothetical protein